jgi:hypothetical protein
MRGDEFEMLDHGMRALGAELAHDAQHHRLGLRALELDLALAEIGFDAGKLAEEIVVPKRAAELAVGDRSQPDVLLLADRLLDLAVFDRRELGCG